MRTPGTLAALLCLAVTMATAQSPETVYQQANQLYQQGKVAEARDLYESIVKNGFVSGDLYYNLGNAYYKSGNISRAILYYERALRLMPGDDDLRHNLQLANLMITDRIEAAPRLFIWEYWDGIKAAFSLRAATWMAYGAYLLVIAAAAAFVLAPSYRTRKAALLVGIASCVVLVGLVVLFYGKLSDSTRADEAILQASIVTVKNSPDTKSSDAFVLHSGVKVQIIDTVGDWVKIRLADGKVGWMEGSAAEII
jgi:tetratricopeptide (TPR) repeat protein